MRSTLSLLVAGLLAGLLVPCAEAEPVAWTQFGLGDDPDLIARALPDGDGCPSITVDGVTTPMRERLDGRAAQFGRLCEERRRLAQGLRVRIADGERVLLDQAITRDPRTIAVIGDTGCRVIKTPDGKIWDQHCDDPTQWPFAQVATEAAGHAPDLVVHLGDYYYRETQCTTPAEFCARTPYGDRGPTWQAEFFQPARALLARAPWLFVRGNHEDCDRGGNGWSYYFGDGQTACAVVTDAAIVRLARLTLLNVDSAHADDKSALATVNLKWQSIADSVVPKLAGTDGTIVLVTHIPQYVACPKTCDNVRIANIGGVRAIADRLRATGRPVLLLGGHFHTFQTFDAPGIRQVIVGNGGANLDQYAPGLAPPALAPVAFADWRRGGADWQIEPQGKVLAGQVQIWGGRFGFSLLTPATLELALYAVGDWRQFGCDLAGAAPPRCR
jgi:hypothetical protein